MNIRCILLCALSAMMAVFLAGCAAGGSSTSASTSESQEVVRDAAIYENAGIQPGDLLVDYYFRIMGTKSEQGYSELTLTYISPDEADLSLYEGVPDEMETRTRYTVSIKAADRCLAAIDQAGMASWNNQEDLTSVDGIVEVVRFYDLAERHWVRVSNEWMPEDGRALMAAVRDIMKECIPA